MMINLFRKLKRKAAPPPVMSSTRQQRRARIAARNRRQRKGQRAFYEGQRLQAVAADNRAALDRVLAGETGCTEAACRNVKSARDWAGDRVESLAVRKADKLQRDNLDARKAAIIKATT